MSREKKVRSAPTTQEVGAMADMISTWPEVLDEELGRYFRRETPDRREEARSMLKEYLLVRCANYFDRYVPDRDRTAPSKRIRTYLDRSLSEPRGAFRRWVRPMTQWVYRDWVRQRRQTGEAFEMHVTADGDKDAVGVSFDRLRDESHDVDLDGVDEARDIVAALMSEAPDDLAEDICLFLGAEERGRDPKAVYRAFGTNSAAVMSRLQALRPLALNVMRRNAPAI